MAYVVFGLVALVVLTVAVGAFLWRDRPRLFLDDPGEDE